MTDNPFGRMLTAMVTPMRPDGSIDKDGVTAVVKHLLANGHDGIVVNGTTGEASTLSTQESLDVLALVLAAAHGKAKVVMGVGSNDTAHAIAMTQDACEAGADAVLLVSPYYNKPTQAGLIAHSRAVADASTVPVMLYDIPGRTGVQFTPDTLIELARHPRIQAVKDAKGDLWATTRVLEETDLLVFSGADELNLPLLALGAHGVVSVVGHVAGRQYADLIAAVDAGDLQRARGIHRSLIPITEAIMNTSQGAIMAKAALAQRGVIASAHVRLPLVESPKEHLDRLKKALTTVAGA